VGSHSIDIISFTVGSVRYDLNLKSALKVSTLGKSPSVNVRAVARFLYAESLLGRGRTESHFSSCAFKLPDGSQQHSKADRENFASPGRFL
jgi:hypothetical protein